MLYGFVTAKKKEKITFKDLKAGDLFTLNSDESTIYLRIKISNDQYVLFENFSNSAFALFSIHEKCSMTENVVFNGMMSEATTQDTQVRRLIQVEPLKLRFED